MTFEEPSRNPQDLTFGDVFSSRQLKLNHACRCLEIPRAVLPAPALRSRQGIVSHARNACPAPASINALMRGRWKVHEFFFGQPIVSSIFGAVREERAVWTDGCGDEWLGPADAIRFICPEFIPRFDGKVDGFLEQGKRLRFIQAAFHEAFDGGLITGGDGAVRAGFEVIEMELPYCLGLLEQNLCRPQVIFQVVAAASSSVASAPSITRAG
jgi:hypothetical protein